MAMASLSLARLTFVSTAAPSSNPRLPLSSSCLTTTRRPRRTTSLVVSVGPRDPSQLSDEWGADPKPTKDVSDEWGSDTAAAPIPASAQWDSPVPSSDPPLDDDEWGNGTSQKPQPEAAGSARLTELKQCLVDSVYGTELGFRASVETRAEIVELVSQLEAANPTPAPVDSPQLLDGKWILVFTAFSELLPLLAAGATPLLKVKTISQAIDTQSSTIVNATTLSSPFASFSFSATATFQVRSPSRIQVEFKESEFQPPEISSTVNLPEEIDILGQKISLRPVEQSLQPLQQVFASIAGAISGQPPLKVPIPGNRTQSWLLTTYLDEDFRISRGDGGLFVLLKEGSSLLA